MQLNQALTGCLNNVYKQHFFNLVPQFQNQAYIFNSLTFSKNIHICLPYQIPEPAQHFLSLMRDLRSVAELRISITAPKEMAKEKVLHKMWTDTENTREKVMQLQAELQLNDLKLQLQLDEKNTKLTELQEKRDHLNDENKGNIEKEML